MQLITINDTEHHITDVPAGINYDRLWPKKFTIQPPLVIVSADVREASWIMHQIQQQIDLVTLRARLLAELRTQNIPSVTMTYSGYGDSGQIEDVTLDHDEVSDFLWNMMWLQHHGFENNDGGNGEVTWNIEADTIHIIHNDVIETYDTTETIL